MTKSKYRLTMTSEQAHGILKAVDLMMRLKLGQYEELPFALIDLSEPDFCQRRDSAKVYLKPAFEELLGRSIKKDHEWYVLYNIIQVVRHAIQQVEYPDSKGVDSYPPIDFNGVGLPDIEVIFDE